jgi:enoyl-CoA hydratase
LCSRIGKSLSNPLPYTLGSARYEGHLSRKVNCDCHMTNLSGKSSLVSDASSDGEYAQPVGISSNINDRGIAEVIMDCPPVNALTVAEWFEVADTITALGRDKKVRVVVLRAEGRGFNAGVDIKEMQNTEGFDALIGANKGCYAAFAAVYDCPVPVITAVAGFCVGGGIGLVGNSDIIIASDDAFFGLPEVDRGALGAATHLARLVPQHKMRAMVYTSATATAAELHAFGSVLQVVPRAELRDAAMKVAESIADKHPTVIRAAKESLNGIDLWDVKRSYRFEQGFTFELNLTGVADELRDDFAGTDKKNKKDGN